MKFIPRIILATLFFVVLAPVFLIFMNQENQKLKILDSNGEFKKQTAWEKWASIMNDSDWRKSQK